MAVMEDLQLEDLSKSRRAYIFESDYKENYRVTGNAALQSQRLVNKAGTQEYAAAKSDRQALSAWGNAHLELSNDGTAEDDLEEIGTGFGQSHRQKLINDPTLLRGVKNNQPHARPQTRRQTRPRSPPNPVMVKVGGVQINHEQLQLAKQMQQEFTRSKMASKSKPSSNAFPATTRKRVVKGSDPYLLAQVANPAKGKENEAAAAAASFKRQERTYHAGVLSDPSEFMKAATTRLGLKTAAEKPAKVVKPIPKLPSKPVEESVPKTVPSVNNLPSAQSSGATALPSTDPVSLSGQVNPPGSQPGFTSAPTVDNKYLAALASLKDALPPALLAQVQQLVLAAQSSQQTANQAPLSSSLEATRSQIVVNHAKASALNQQIKKDVEEVTRESSKPKSNAIPEEYLKAQYANGYDTEAQDDQKKTEVSSPAATAKPPIAPDAPLTKVISSPKAPVKALDSALKLSSFSMHDALEEATKVVSSPKVPMKASDSTLKPLSSSIHDALEEELKRWVSGTDQGNSKCMVPECTKKFKTPDFWRKHVDKVHSEWRDKIKAAIRPERIPAPSPVTTPAITVTSYPVAEPKLGPSTSANSAANFPGEQPGTQPVPALSHPANSSLAMRLKRQRVAIIGEHIYKHRYQAREIVLEQEMERLGVEEPKNPAPAVWINNSMKEPKSTVLADKTNNSGVKNVKATSNPFGPSTKMSLSTALSNFSKDNPISSDLGAAARAQYGGGGRDVASAPATFVQPSPPFSKTRSKNTLGEETRRIVPATGSGPSLPSFLQGATASTDPGDAARRQYAGGSGGKKGKDPLELAKKRGM